MIEKTENELKVEELWRKMLINGEFEDKRRMRIIFRALPGNLRCKVCYVPFDGSGSYISKRIFRRYPSNLNPKLCNECDEFVKKHRGGVEVELTLLFADVRGSTTLAEGMSPTAFSKLINRFYSTATNVMVNADALIDKIIGDQAAGIFVPGFAGNDHARRAINAARSILEKTGHKNPEGPWIPLGVGVHTGIAYVGALGSENGTADVTVLGDVANTAARLSSSAKIGEILISQTAFERANLTEMNGLERRELQLKGKSEKLLVSVLTSNADAISS